MLKEHIQEMTSSLNKPCFLPGISETKLCITGKGHVVHFLIKYWNFLCHIEHVDRGGVCRSFVYFLALL